MPWYVLRFTINTICNILPGHFRKFHWSLGQELPLDTGPISDPDKHKPRPVSVPRSHHPHRSSAKQSSQLRYFEHGSTFKKSRCHIHRTWTLQRHPMLLLEKGFRKDASQEPFRYFFELSNDAQNLGQKKIWLKKLSVSKTSEDNATNELVQINMWRAVHWCIQDTSRERSANAVWGNIELSSAFWNPFQFLTVTAHRVTMPKARNLKAPQKGSYVQATV